MKGTIRYVFLGSADFSAVVLTVLGKGGFIPAAVVTNPDRPVGRKHILTPPPVKTLIAREGWPTKIFQPERMKDIILPLTSLDLDLGVMAAFGRVLPASLLALPRHGTVGVHPSLLPRDRGATPEASHPVIVSSTCSRVSRVTRTSPIGSIHDLAPRV